MNKQDVTAGKKITITIPQGWNDTHIKQITSKIMGGCIGLLLPYDEKRFELIRYRIESILYSYIKELSDDKSE